METSFDLVIAGGGPVGALLALALGDTPFAVLHVDSAEQGAERPIALSQGSRLLLERCGVFHNIPSTAISIIHVSQRAGFGRTLLRAKDYALPALGYVANYSAIRAAIAGKVKAAPLVGRITAWDQAPGGLAVILKLPDGEERSIKTRLLVLADGSPPEMRGTFGDAAPARNSRVCDYGQSALVAQVRAEIPHRNIAYERFTPQGPLALLPNNEGHALVWCTNPEEAQNLRTTDTQDFLARLGEAFGMRLGRFVDCGERHCFALALRYQSGRSVPRVIAVGNAAQTLHPVGGQGMNLGLRDAWELAAAILKAGHQLDQPEFASAFVRQRRADRRAEISLTDALVRVFSQPNHFLGAARGAALLAIDALPQARRVLADAMMYGLRTGR